MPDPTWKDTRLWKAIEGSDREAITLTLKNSLPVAELVLKSGGTFSVDFTLHDKDHAYRVAERIPDLLTGFVEEVLSDTEIALLLLAAYLHDIGMAPQRATAEKHWQYLNSGDPSLMDSTEMDDLQSWLDREHAGITAPVGNAITASGLKLSEQIFAYYCRSKHNDWSEAWIRDNLASVTPGLYPTWIDDLITLCRSHHESLPELRAARFTAKLVGSPARPINLRFLAALLRVADVLEFDPERTPAVILEHRAIAPSSRIFWSKDHYISFKVEPDDHRMLFAARTPNAAVHKAVLETRDAVDEELACCVVLEQEGAFRDGTIPNAERDRYRWPWPARLNSDISEQDGTFVFIQGDFRPDTGKILSLLSGSQLYGHRFAAIRELLQNAVDAVREQVARERLQKSNPTDPTLAATLGGLHTIRLSFERDDNGFWLRCTDDGVGMTREIIEKHLLVSGSGTRPEMRALERDAQAKGFSIERTGQFGIGLISYFMLGDHLEIVTRRSAEAGDPDHTAWRFVTDGLASFGELSRTSRASKGSEVRLRLKDFEKESSTAFFEAVRQYVRQTLRFIPCQFELVDSVGGSEGWKPSVGWTAEPSDFSQMVLADNSYHHQSSDLQTKEEIAEREERERQQQDARKNALRVLKWFGPFECELPNGMGKARMWLPYFLVSDEVSLVYMDAVDGAIRSIGKAHGITSNQHDVMSWRGFNVNSSIRLPFGVAEIDLTSQAEISIDRRILQSKSMAHVNAFLHKTMTDLVVKFLTENQKSKFDIMNRCVMLEKMRIPIEAAPVAGQNFWIAPLPRAGDFSLRSVKPPFFSAMESRYGYDHVTAASEIGERQAQRLQYFRLDDYHHVLRPENVIGGGRLVFHQERSSFGLYWESQSDLCSIGDPRANFPDEFSEVAAIICQERRVYNRGHWLVAQAIAGHSDLSGGSIDAERLMESTATPASASAAILFCLFRGEKFCRAVRDHYPGVLEKLLTLARIESGTRIRILMFPEGNPDTMVELSGREVSEVQIFLNKGVKRWEDHRIMLGGPQDNNAVSNFVEMECYAETKVFETIQKEALITSDSLRRLLPGAALAP